MQVYIDFVMFVFVVKDGRKFRYIAVLEIRRWIKRRRLNERTACLNGKFLKGFIPTTSNYILSLYSYSYFYECMAVNELCK